MANSNSAQSAPWPIPKFRFEADFGPDLKGILFQEVSGLDTETQIIEYRKANSPIFSAVKMPGLAKYGNVTMKKGVFVNDNSFLNWHNEIKMNTIKKRTVLISLLDESGSVTMQWQLNNAWPTKITGTDLKSDGSEIAVETIEIAHEGLTITNGK
ncbi:MAG: phage tail protein [Chitinophagaceae bacterium]|nr:phage tail protein [Chitinophagaceae bacterium]